MKLDNIALPRIPTSSDFKESALNKALFNYSISHWSFRYSIPLLAIALISGLLFGFTYSWFLIILGIFGAGACSLVFNLYCRGGVFKQKYTQNLLRALEKQTELRLADLKENLISFGNKHGARQLEQFQQKFVTLVDILKTKFDVTQLTYNRYYSIAQEVYLSGIDNLNDIVVAMKTLKSIDLNYINGRLEELKSKEADNMAIIKEQEALNRSLQSHTLQEDKIDRLIAENESALTQIDEATVAISEISKSKDKEAQIDMENSMKQLAEMAKRTKLYSR